MSRTIRSSMKDMNAEPDIYPAEALADEEPRYLRRQKPLEIRRRKFGRGSWPTYRRWLLAGAGLLATGCASAITATRFLPVLSARGAGRLRSDRNHRQSLRQPRRHHRKIRRRSRARASCAFRSTPAAQRSRRFPGSRRPASQRALPNRIRVEITERTPVAFLRTGNELALVDANGVILDRPLEGDFRFPVVSGFDETMPLPDRAEAHAPLRRVMKEIDLARAGRQRAGQRSGSLRRQDLRATLAGLPGLESTRPSACTSATPISSTNIACWSTISVRGAPAPGAWNRWTCVSRGRWW